MQNIKNSLFVKSFQEIDKRFLIMILLNVLFYVGMVIVIVIGLMVFKVNYERLSTTIPFIYSIQSQILEGNMPEFNVQTTAQLEQTKKTFDSFVAVSVILLVVLFLLINTIISFFKGYIWSKILHIKFDFTFFKKIALVTMIWSLAWGLLFVATYLIFKKEYLFYPLVIEGALFIYFSFILYSKSNETIKKQLKDTFTIGMKHIHTILLAIIITSIIFILLFYITKIFTMMFSKFIFYLVIFIIYVLIINWLRIDIALIIKKLSA